MFRLNMTDSPSCTFCKREVESFEHLFFYCDITKTFWEALCSWLGECKVKSQPFTIMDIIFGVFNTEDDYIILNHLILTAKFYIYKCKSLLASLSGQDQCGIPSGKKDSSKTEQTNKTFSEMGEAYAICWLIVWVSCICTPLSHIIWLFSLPFWTRIPEL